MLPAGFALVKGWLQSLEGPTAYALQRMTLADMEGSLKWEQRSRKMFGKEVLTPRLTCWMGDAAYTYSQQRHEPAPMPHWVRMFRDLAQDATATVAGTPIREAVRFNSVLANLYRDGRDSVAWHADDEKELGLEPVIASVSLGSPRRFDVRKLEGGKTVGAWTMTLEHGDLLVMSGRSQLDYQHSVPKAGAAAGARLNLTFRRVAA